jgi:hypothetical protein
LCDHSNICTILGMLTALRETIDKLPEPVVVNDELLREAFALRGRYDAWVSSLVDTFDRDQTYALDGAASMTAWLQHRCAQTGRDAARCATTARKLRRLPLTNTRWRDGTLSPGHVAAIAACVKNRHLDLFAQGETELLPALAALEVHDATTVLRQWTAAADDAQPGPDPEDPVDSLHVSATLDGRGEIRGSVSPDTRETIEHALRLAKDNDADKPASQRNADALSSICEFFLNNHQKTTTRRNRPHLTVIVREDGDGQPVGTYLDGTPVARSRLEQFFCDGMLGRLTMRGSEILDLDKPTEWIPTGIWQAVAIRDRTCRWHGCHRPAANCEAHHVTPRRLGGCTKVTNLVLLCSFHYRLLHKRGWHATLDTAGRLDITTADGQVLTTYPPHYRRPLWPPGHDPA